MVIKRFKVSKLMRNKIPQWMEANEIKYSMSKATPESMLSHLYLKLEEETEELLAFCKSKHMSKMQAEHEIIDEMADIMEVMQCIAKEKGIKWEDIEAWKSKKAEERGGFQKGVYINWVELSEDNPMIRNYKQNYYYPEIERHEHHVCGNPHHKHHEHHEHDEHDEHKEAKDSEMHGERHYEEYHEDF